MYLKNSKANGFHLAKGILFACAPLNSNIPALTGVENIEVPPLLPSFSRILPYSRHHQLDKAVGRGSKAFPIANLSLSNRE